MAGAAAAAAAAALLLFALKKYWLRGCCRNFGLTLRCVIRQNLFTYGFLPFIDPNWASWCFIKKIVFFWHYIDFLTVGLNGSLNHLFIFSKLLMICSDFNCLRCLGTQNCPLPLQHINLKHVLGPLAPLWANKGNFSPPSSICIQSAPLGQLKPLDEPTQTIVKMQYSKISISSTPSPIGAPLPS